MLTQADNGNDKVDRDVVKKFFDEEDFTHMSGSVRKWCHTFVDAGGDLLRSKMPLSERASFSSFLETNTMVSLYVLKGLIEDSDDAEEREFYEGLEKGLGRLSVILERKGMLYS